MSPDPSSCECTALDAPDFDLAQTLCCAAELRWKARPDGFFDGVAGDSALAWDERTAPFDHGRSRCDLLAQLFRPRHGLCRHARNFLQNAGAGRRLPVRTAASASCGRRLGGARQLILSQNNNIKRITASSSGCAKRSASRGSGAFAFPTPERLAICTADDLSPAAAAFARGISSTRPKRSPRARWTSPPSPRCAHEARALLMRIAGVGPKSRLRAAVRLYRLDASPTTCGSPAR